MIVKDIIDAIRKNGLPQARGAYVQYGDNSVPIAACAIGQAAINLKKPNFAVVGALGRIYSTEFGNLDSYIIVLNDSDHLTFAEIADRVEQDFAEFMNESVEL